MSTKLLKVALDGLTRFGDPADRAREMLEESVALLDEARPRSSELAAYAIRECLEQIPSLFGIPSREFDLETPVRALLSKLTVTETATEGGRVDPDRIQVVLELLENRETTRAQRVAEAMASQLPIDTRTEDFAAFARDWADLVDILNSIIHEESPHRNEIASLVETGIRLVAAIAGQMSQRLDRVDEILATTDTPADELVEEAMTLTADPRLSVYFYSRLDSPDWLEPLRAHGAFDALGLRFQYQGQYLKRVAMERPDAVLELMEGVVQSDRAFDYLALEAATSIGPAAMALIQKVLERADGQDLVGFAFGELVAGWESAGHAAELPTLADIALNLSFEGGSLRARGKFSDHEMGRVVSKLVELCAPGVLKDLAQVLVWKIEKVLRAANEAEYRMFSLERQTVYASDEDTFADRPMASLVDGLRDVLTRMRDAGVPLETREELLDLTYELFTRIWQNHVAEAPDEDLGTSRLILLEALKSWATPESLRLLRSAWPVLDIDSRSELLVPLGDPGIADQVGDWESNEDLHKELLRVRQWLVAIADDVPEEWKTAYAKLVGQFGLPDAEAVTFRMEFFSGSLSPLNVDEVEALGAQGLIDWISDWQPEEGIRSPTPEMLGRTIAEAVGKDASRWITDLSSTIEGLGEPVYIRGVFAGLTEAAKESRLEGDDLESIVSAAELVWTEPWQSALDLRDKFDFDSDWSRAKRQIVGLFAELARSNAPIVDHVDRFGALLEEQAWDMDSQIGVTPADPFTAALNKANTEALRGLIDLALYSYRQGLSDAWSQRMFDILEAQVSEEGDNSLAVAGLAAVYWPQLMLLDQEGAQGLRNAVFGPPEADKLRVTVLESAIAYSRATKPGLSNLKSHLLAYLRHVGGRDDEYGRGKAITWLLLGYLWSVDNWLNLDELIAFLIEIGQMSAAAADYGRILRNTDPLPEDVQEVAVEFWERSLNAEAEPDQYKGFGWWSEAALSDGVWLTLVHHTLKRSNGGIDWLDGVIERLARLSLDVLALEALEMALLGVDKGDPWAVRLSEKQIIDALETAKGEHGDSDVFQRIVELLLEREMYQFRRFLLPGDHSED